ncbi:MAG: sigma-70 family RNA polymerase sigma factor, partial [Alphaproteobacteria bacterium]
MVTDLFREELISLIPRMRRFARGLAGDADRADDLVQDAIERAWMHRDRWREGTRLDSWLYRIIRNRWIDAWRAAKARGEDMDAEAAAGLPGVDGRAAFEAEPRKLEIAPRPQ